MSFSQFVELLLTSNIERYSVFCFVAKTYPLLYLAFIKQLIEKQCGSLTTIDVSVMSVRELYSSLEISFLGQKNYFWLTNIQELNQKNRSTLIAYLQKYKGPNTLFLCESQELLGAENIELLEHIGHQDFEAYARACNTLPIKQAFFKEVFRRYPKLSLDSLALLMNYSQVISRPALFFDHWLPLIVESNCSLFALTTYFFGKNEEAFWPYWALIYHEYSDPFWTVFWGDQLFRAYSFITYTQKGKAADAKKIAYNLPFTFMQRDRKKVTRTELANAHQFIYDLDWNVKNGLHPHFQLFFLSYFSGDFKNQKDKRRLDNTL